MMKKTTIFLATMFFINIGISQVVELPKAMIEGNQPCLILPLPDSDSKDVKKLWDKFMKDYGTKPKKVKKADVSLADDVSIPQISGNTIDVYNIIEQNGDMTNLSVWYNLGGAYLSNETHPDAFAQAEKMLVSFSYEVERFNIEEELEEEQKLLKDKKGELDKLVSQKGKLEQNIKDYEQKIVEAKEDIVTNEASQKNKQVEIETQNDVIEKVKIKLADVGKVKKQIKKEIKKAETPLAREIEQKAGEEEKPEE